LNSRLASGGEAPRPNPRTVLSIALEEGEDLRGPLGRLFEGRPWPQLLRSTRRESAMWLRTAIETSKGTIRSWRPWIRRTAQ
jgi:hypothetical protein